MYIEHTDPWEKLTSIINNVNFAPECMYTYPAECGIRRVHASMINPTVLVADLRTNLLSPKSGKLRSDYWVSYRNFQNHEQHENNTFSAFVNGCS